VWVRVRVGIPFKVRVRVSINDIQLPHSVSVGLGKNGMP